MGVIYALIDPRNDLIRYIGKTIQKPRIRFASHIRESKTKKYHVSNWIKRLISEGFRPIMKILIEVPNEKTPEIEIKFIAHFKSFCNLTNITLGGEGCLGRKQSDAEKKKHIISGTYEKARQRMLGPSNPGRNRPKTKFYIFKTEDQKKISRLKMSEKMKEKNPSFLRRREVLQLDLSGKFINEWDSVTSAAKNVSVNSTSIVRCCQGKTKTIKGFTWKYKNNEM